MNTDLREFLCVAVPVFFLFLFVRWVFKSAAAQERADNVFVLCPVCNYQVKTEKKHIKPKVMETPLAELHKLKRSCPTCQGDLWPLILMDPWMKDLVAGKEELRLHREHANAYIESLAHISGHEKEKA